MTESSTTVEEAAKIGTAIDDLRECLEELGEGDLSPESAIRRAIDLLENVPEIKCKLEPISMYDPLRRPETLSVPEIFQRVSDCLVDLEDQGHVLATALHEAAYRYEKT